MPANEALLENLSANLTGPKGCMVFSSRQVKRLKNFDFETNVREK